MTDSTQSVQHLLEMLNDQAVSLRATYGAEASVALVFSCGTAIWNRNINRVAIVNALLAAGGKSLGLYRVFGNGKTVFTESMLFNEDTVDPWVRTQFKAITRTIGDGVLASMKEQCRIEAVRDFRGGSEPVQ